MTNFYWPVYKSLEQEFVNISNIVHIDDKQNSVYSVKIAELLLRCVVEIESISKDLFLKHGGKQSEDGGNLYFDTDCIAFLDSKWLLSEKKVIVSSANIYFKNAENKELFPLKKAKNRGSSGSDWAKAYQAVKHDRVKHIDKANVKHLIRALAALYILNIYYKDEVFNLINSKDTDFSSNWSSLFDINIHSWNGNGRCGYIKNENFDECIYLIKFTSRYTEEFETWNTEQGKIAMSNILRHPKVIEDINKKLFKDGAIDQEKLDSYFINREWLNQLDIRNEYDQITIAAMDEASKKTGFNFQKRNPEFEAVLNKNQSI